jgi:hypothetical protein
MIWLMPGGVSATGIEAKLSDANRTSREHRKRAQYHRRYNKA